MEPTNAVDKYSVCVKKDNNIVGHTSRKDGRAICKNYFFYFMHADEFATCDVFVTGNAVNLGDNTGQKVPHMLNVKGRKNLFIFYKSSCLLFSLYIYCCLVCIFIAV